MKRPIAVRWSDFDLDEVSEEIREVSQDLADYLSSFSAESGGRSKHAVMGPVAKVLTRARAALLVPEDLLGMALRAHEQTSQIPLTGDSREQLERGVLGLVQLLKTVPEASRSEVIARIDHSVYWLRKKAQLERWDQEAANFRRFIQQKYGSNEQLYEAWGEKAKDEQWTIDRVPYPSRALSSRNDQIGADVRQYWETKTGVDVN